MRDVDVAVVGGGIVGLAHAVAAARRGRSVVVFERGRRAEQASVRNFGMVWPIGQPFGRLRQTALASRRLWLDLRAAADVWADECGSVHVAHHPDEWAVLTEFAALARDNAAEVTLLSPADVRDRFPHFHRPGLIGAIHSPTELVVDPRQAMAALAKHVAEQPRVEVRFETAVTHVDMPTVRTASGETYRAGTCLVCSGADFETLFPAVYAASGLRRCKLQMMATGPQPDGWKLGPHFAGGLTLGHYAAFEACPSLPQLKRRVAETMPEFVRFGIHVMASQNRLGEVIIGDSHEYDAGIGPFDDPHIDDLILGYLRERLHLPDPTIRRRWHGVYAKHPTVPQFTAEPQPGCHVVASPGGAGMTLALGLADAWWAAT